MMACIKTVAFEGIDVVPIDVQVQIASGLPAFNIVGLPDKAVAESKERVRSALHAIGLSLPPKRLVINLSPADLRKEGSHYDLPIALGLLVAMEIIPEDALDHFIAMGELALDGRLSSVHGILPAAIQALSMDHGLICPESSGTEAAWAGNLEIIAPAHIIGLVNHFKGTQVLKSPEIPPADNDNQPINFPDLADVKGQETAKRALEIAAAGGHNLLMVGPPGSGKSMLASRLPGILPPLTPQQALDVSMIHSIAGILENNQIVRIPPYRDPHHSASLPSLIGGGQKAKPGEISLAHHGVLFLDELPEFSRSTLESLRQPLETGKTLIARANHHITYPSDFQLIAAMNPCRCGHLDDPALACSSAPKCALNYQNKISGPLMDRFDLHVDVPALSASDLTNPLSSESSALVAERVKQARAVQKQRFGSLNNKAVSAVNSQLNGQDLEKAALLTPDAQALLTNAIDRMKLSGRGYHRILKVSRTIADLDHQKNIEKNHVAEALSFRRILPASHSFH